MAELKLQFTQDYGKTWEDNRTITADSINDCFRQLERLNNRYRYCNGWFFRCANAEEDKAFCQWQKQLTHAESFALYYGNSTVD